MTNNFLYRTIQRRQWQAFKLH